MIEYAHVGIDCNVLASSAISNIDMAAQNFDIQLT